MKEGGIYSVKNFSLHPNKDVFHIVKNTPFIIEFDGQTSVRKVSVKSDGFIRYPFELVELENLEVTNNKYLIARLFSKGPGQGHLISILLIPVRVTLWGGLGEKLIEKRTCHVGLYSDVLTSMSVKLYNNRLYLFNSSSTLIIDDDGIPALKQMKTDQSDVGTSKEILPVDFSKAKAGTLENLLIIDVFTGCNLQLYRLEPEVFDHTDAVMVVMFDETATSLVGCSAYAVLAAEEQERVEEESGERYGTTLERVEIKDSDAESSFVANTQSETVDGERSNKTRKAVNLSFSLCCQNAEVTALITNDFGDGIPTKDIIVNKQDSRPKRILELHPSYMSLQYPLLFPYGEDDFHDSIPYYINSGAHKTNRGYVTMKEYYSYIIHHRKDQGTTLTAAKIDDIISTKLPSPTDDPEGYKVVTEYMLHGPCETEGKYAPYTTEGKCTKCYPKEFYAETILDDDGYPIYRRWDNKVYVKKGKFTFDNRYVNVQAGGARAPEKVEEINEIKNYLNCRYLAPCEAVWRMLSFDIHYSYPAVMKLNFHLPQQNPITLCDLENLPGLLQREGIASLLLPGGRTGHSRFVIPLELLENSTCGIKQNTHLAELMQEVQLIIWNEAPNDSKICIRGLRQDSKRYTWFSQGRKMGQDFRRHDGLALGLTRSMRVNEYDENGEIEIRKQDFNQWVLAVGDGTLPTKAKEDKINAYIFEKLAGSAVTYNSADEVWKASTENLEQQHLFPTEFLNTLNFSGMSPHTLCLKKELPIMLLRNVNPSKGLCNETRLIITELEEFIIREKILTRSHWECTQHTRTRVFKLKTAKNIRVKPVQGYSSSHAA
uniref:ATP-dependent DNA helicase n=1 Tax=Tanacetum cinerariifolium TaxID=118510 RepID=A0A699GV76_TANCI|nr:AT hook motif-containing protein, putative, expressed [Tanacetum cinerariifolium]